MISPIPKSDNKDWKTMKEPISRYFFIFVESSDSRKFSVRSLDRRSTEEIIDNWKIRKNFTFESSNEYDSVYDIEMIIIIVFACLLIISLISICICRNCMGNNNSGASIVNDSVINESSDGNNETTVLPDYFQVIKSDFRAGRGSLPVYKITAPLETPPPNYGEGYLKF